ncbi:MAG: MFS transporter [Anaerolineales bacterium]|nr:MFS transporter [Anaerolineales bacterium]
MIASKNKSGLGFLGEYARRVRMFRPNARLYLTNVIITGLAGGVFRLLFNFYVLSLGYDEALLGRLITVSSTASLLAALPAGYLADLLGRKRSLIVGGLVSSFSFIAMVLWPTAQIFYLLNILTGVAQSLVAVTMAPFLMENSGEEERTYLFSFGHGLQMLSAFAGNWLGGYLPGWFGLWRGISPTDSQAYGGAIIVVSVLFTVGLIPLLLLRRNRMVGEARSVFAPVSYAMREPALLTKLILPTLITSIGAGLVMPFMNVFFRVVHNQPDPVIGTLFAWGSLAMGIGLLAAPPLADRFGKIQVVVVSQALSVPFLILLGFSPWFAAGALAYYVRLTLMNMSNPVYQTFVMEQVDPEARATVASLSSMAWSFGWAFSPSISGSWQVSYGFGPPFIGTIVLYSIAISLYWAFFWRQRTRQQSGPAVA